MSGLQAALHSASRPAVERDEPTATGTERLPLSLLEPDTKLRNQDTREPYLPSAHHAAEGLALSASQAETPSDSAPSTQGAAAEDIPQVEPKQPLPADAAGPALRRHNGRRWFIAAAFVTVGGVGTSLLLVDARKFDFPADQTHAKMSTSRAVPATPPTVTSVVAGHVDAGGSDQVAQADGVASRESVAGNGALTGADAPRPARTVDRARRAGWKAKTKSPPVAAREPSAVWTDTAGHTEPSVSNPFATAAPQPLPGQPPSQGEVPTSHEKTTDVAATPRSPSAESGTGTSAGARRNEARDVDAIVGSAAIAAAAGRRAEARDRFEQALKVDPRHSDAAAGLLALVARDNPQRAEQMLLQAIAQSPAPALYFALGNVYAGQSDWRRARGAYERALALMPINADYAYNLAVAHDHLAQYGAALQNYRAALASRLDAVHPGFDVERVQQRIAHLEHRVDGR